MTSTRKLAFGILTLSTVTLIGFGCGKLGSYDFASNEIDESSQSAGDDLSSMDESVSGAVSTREGVEEALETFALADQADRNSRAICTSANFASCGAGARTRDFDNCTIGTTTWDGTINLAFSDATCKMDSAGKTVTRTLASPGMIITGRRGGTITATTDTATTWDGTSVGGGHRLTRTATGYTLSILGIHRSGKIGTTEFMNISRKTTTDLTITGTGRNGRTVTAGTIVTYHNLKDFNMAWTPSNLTWGADCRCPTSGTMTGTATGSVEGTFTMTFGSTCGSVTLAKDDSSETVTLDSCN